MKGFIISFIILLVLVGILSQARIVASFIVIITAEKVAKIIEAKRICRVILDKTVFSYNRSENWRYRLLAPIWVRGPDITKTNKYRLWDGRDRKGKENLGESQVFYEDSSLIFLNSEDVNSLTVC